MHLWRCVVNVRQVVVVVGCEALLVLGERVVVLGLRRFVGLLLALDLRCWCLRGLGFHGLFFSLLWLFTFWIQLLSDLWLLLLLFGWGFRLWRGLRSLWHTDCLLRDVFLLRLLLSRLLGIGLLLYFVGEDLTGERVAGFLLGLHNLQLLDIGLGGESATRLTQPGRMAHHLDDVGRGAVDAKRDLLVLKVVNRVEMAQEELTKNEVLVVKFVQFVLGDRELALVRRLVEVLARADLKDRVTGLLST